MTDAVPSQRQDPSMMFQPADRQPRSRGGFSKAVDRSEKVAASGTNGKKHDAEYDTVKQSEENIRIMLAEVERLKLEKQKAVEAEEFEEAGMLKRRIKVLEDSIGENNKTIDMLNEAKEKAQNVFQKTQQKPKQKPRSQLEHGESLIPTDDPTKMRLVSDEIEFIQKQRLAMKERNVTDNTEQGVPKWAYDDIKELGPTAVKTSRPSALSYHFKGMIEDEKWDEGVNFQHSFIVQVPVETAFNFLAYSSRDETPRVEGEDEIFPLGDGVWIQHLPSGIAQLFEPNEDALEENKTWVVRITVHKPRVPGKVKMEAARTVKTVEPFRQKPFYIFRKVWRLRPGPSGGTHITRIICDFKQFELLEFNALDAVSRQIEIDSEKMRMSWSTAVALAPEKTLSVAGRKHHDHVTTLARRMEESNEMYSATFEVDGEAESVFEALVSNELLDHLHGDLLTDKSYLRADESQVLIRRTDGVVLLIRTTVSDFSFSAKIFARQVGKSVRAALLVTKPEQVIEQYTYTVTNEWTFNKLSETETSIRRVMKDFVHKPREPSEEATDLAVVLTEAADIENRRIIEYFRRQNAHGERIPRPVTAVSVRANYAMRPMPELIDHAAKNHVMEVREMLEIRGADPNYIHVRTDAWTVSDSRIEFYEEITPLVVAAERGAIDVIKVLFNHPQLDVNLCCCAFNDLEIYNYYTAYDMTMTRKHPHAAALLRARGVLPASSEHVVKPEFDSVHMRPNRDNANDVYGDDEYGVGEMPAWDSIAEGNPTLAKALQNAANTLSMSKMQALDVRQKIFKDLLANSHPDKHAVSGLLEVATKVFQWLQTVKPWYLDESEAFGSVNMPLADDPSAEDIDRGRDHAKEILHPSGSVYTVW